METYTCIILDDSEIDRLGLLSVLKNFPQFKVIGVFPSPEKALPIVSEIHVDILFLDIQMPGINGLEFRKKVQKVPVCIFISNTPEYALESYELNILDYIVKPLKSSRFAKTADKIDEYMKLRNKALQSSKEEQHFFIKNGTALLRLEVNSIYYLEASRNYTWVVTENDKHLASYNMREILGRTEFSSFIRIHKSYSVAPDCIHKITGSEVILKNGMKLPIGKKHKEDVKETLQGLT